METFISHGTRHEAMSNKSNKDDNTWGRASEVNDAMLGIQPYADDSMFFIVRYSDKAKVSGHLPS